MDRLIKFDALSVILKSLLTIILALGTVLSVPANAATELTYFDIGKITDEAYRAAENSPEGVICSYQDFKYTSSYVYDSAPLDYSGNIGDAWRQRFVDSPEGPISDIFYYWDGSTWLDSGDAYEEFRIKANQTLEVAQKSTSGLECKFGNLKLIQAIGRDPKTSYVGEIGDWYYNSNIKYPESKNMYLWNGSKWLAWPGNNHDTERAKAIRSKVGEFCTYGANKDVFTNFYATPPKNYKGVKGDLWSVAEKETLEIKANYYWSGKSWFISTAEEAIALKKLNDAAQDKARLSNTGEICQAGTVKSTQFFSNKLPKTYTGKVNDRRVIMDRETGQVVAIYYWTGKGWIG